MYPDYSGRLTMLAVGFDTGESLDRLEANRVSNGYPWPVATAPRQMAVDFNVRVQATKLIIAADGEVLYRGGYGTSSEGKWRDVLDAVVQ